MLASSIHNLTRPEWWRYTLGRVDQKAAWRVLQFVIILSSVTAGMWLFVAGGWSLLPALPTHPSLVLTPTMHPPTQHSQQDIGDTIDVAQISALNLFGTAAVTESVVADVVPETPKPETVKATLVGVMYSSNVRAARAIIRVHASKDAKKGRIYKVGELLEGTEAVVAGIEIDRVTLTVGEHAQVLELYTKEDDKKKTLPQPQQTIDKRADPKARAIANKYREKLIKDPTQLGKLLRFTAIYGKGKKDVTGYRISPRRNHADFTAMGFKFGDVVTSIDGIPLDGLINLQKAMRSIENGGVFSIYMLRKNKPLELLLETS